jgi:hypothetical protein
VDTLPKTKASTVTTAKEPATNCIGAGFFFELSIQTESCNEKT